jgi:hypothetical protein
MSDIDKIIIGVLEAFDEAGNAALGPEKGIPLAGNPHATISQRLGQMILYGTPREKKIANMCDAILTWIENTILGIKTDSHCLDAIKDFPKDLPSSG